MFLDKNGSGWCLDLSNYELNLIIKSLNENILLTDRDNDDLDRYLKILYGIRKQKTMRIHRGFCVVCQQKLGPHETHEHLRNPGLLKEDDFLFLSRRNGQGWRLNLSDFNLDLFIKSLDDRIELTEEQNEKLDRILHILFGVRKAETHPNADTRRGGKIEDSIDESQEEMMVSE